MSEELKKVYPKSFSRELLYEPLRVADSVCLILALDFEMDEERLPIILSYLRNLWEELEEGDVEEKAVLEAIVKLYVRER